MQSTGQTSTQELSLVSMQGSAITYATGAYFLSRVVVASAAPIGRRGGDILGERGRRRHPRRRTRAPGRAGYSGGVILLTGATGLVGGEVLPVLLEAGEDVR